MKSSNIVEVLDALLRALALVERSEKLLREAIQGLLSVKCCERFHYWQIKIRSKTLVIDYVELGLLHYTNRFCHQRLWAHVPRNSMIL